MPLKHCGKGPAADVPDEDSGVSCPAADRQQLSIGTPGQTAIADLRPPVEQHAAGFELEDRDPRLRPTRVSWIEVVNGESPAFRIDRQPVRLEVQRQPPDEPALDGIPDGDAPLPRTKQQAAAIRVENGNCPARQAADQLPASQVPDPQQFASAPIAQAVLRPPAARRPG